MIPIDVESLKQQLRHASNPHLGKFGESVYAQLMSKLGHSVEKLHQRRADYLVSGIGRVDVKTKGFLAKTPRTTSRVSETTYCFVDLEEHGISMTHQDCEKRTTLPSRLVTSDEAFDLWSSRPHVIKTAKSALKEALTKRKGSLVEWITETWTLKAAVVYREGVHTQSSFATGSKPWGPDNFHEDSSNPRKLDLKVLIFFEGETDYQVMAYPMRLRSEIHWEPARSTGRLAFDPKAIDSKFVFKNIADFQLNYPQRFL